jgi:hypothetical protein
MAAVSSTTTQTMEAGQAAKVANAQRKQATKDLQKTRLCVYHLQGKCGYGSNCSFAHEAAEVKNAPDLSKTQLCSKFAQGRCTDVNCKYAHGKAELKDAPNFKKKLCKWHAKGAGHCRNGDSCGFVHDLVELRVEPPPGFEPLGIEKSQAETIAPPPGLTKMSIEESDALMGAPSTQSQAVSDITSAPMPEESLFRMMAARGSAPLQHQVATMSAAIVGLQAKLAQLEDVMLQNQVIQMQQTIEQLTQQCSVLEAGLAVAPPAQQPLRSRLRAQAAPFKPSSAFDAKSDDSTSVGSE